MKNLINYTLALLLISIAGYSQEKNTTVIDLSASFGSGFSPSIGISKKWGLGSQGRFKIGTGLRLTNFTGSDIEFITAPADLTADDSKIDTFTLPSTAVTYVGIPIHLQYSFGEKLDVGFNIDVVGLAFGGEQTGTLSTKQASQFDGTVQTASPTSPSILLIGDNDRGSLNSEFYARFWATEKLGIRAGLSFQFIEYTTNQELNFDNDRFRAKIMQPMIGISYRF
jgi:hypothetical protein